MSSTPANKLPRLGQCVALVVGMTSVGCIRYTGRPVTVTAIEGPAAAERQAPLRIPEPSGSGTITVVPDAPRQRLDGFGASVAWYMERIAGSSPESVDKLLFSDLGLDILRLRNRYQRTKSNDRDLSMEVYLVRRATEALGRRPKILLSSWSPPSKLKANQREDCNGNKDCTLLRKNGRFVYGQFADYWLESLRHYASLGIAPDYVSIQTEPDFIPGGTDGGRADATGTDLYPEDRLSLSPTHERGLATLSRVTRFAPKWSATHTRPSHDDPNITNLDWVALGGRQFLAQSVGTSGRGTQSGGSSPSSIDETLALGKPPGWGNEPGFVARRMEGCRFDPTENEDYPGYGRALAAVHGRLQALRSPPKLIAPETRGIHGSRVEDYLRNLKVDQVGVVAHHLFSPGGLGITGWKEPGPDDFSIPMRDLSDTNATLVWTAGFRTEGDTLTFDQRPAAPLPIWQTEFGTDEDNGIEGGFETAWFIHNALVDEGVAAFLYWNLVWSEDDGLVSLERNQATPRDQYYAVKHYARYTDPGYVRVETTSDAPELRASAFLSPDGDQLTVVVLNTDLRTLAVSVDTQDYRAQDSAVYRTVFRPGRSERWKAMGNLSETGSLTLPGRSSATVVFRRGG